MHDIPCLLAILNTHKNVQLPFLVYQGWFMSNDGGFEKYIIELLNNAEGSVMWDGIEYGEIRVYKPSISTGGECKTDAYVSLIKNGIETNTLAVTIKKDTAHFWGNKLKAQAAENLLGEDWSSILKESIYPIREKLLSREIFSAKPKKTPTDIFFTLGWKLEITKVSRPLSAPLVLDKKEIVEKILMGVDQTDSQKNPTINGQVIYGAGVARFLLEGNEDNFDDAQSVLDSLIDLSTYSPPDAYLVFTANNYRIMANKADGPRSLAVSVAWEMVGDKIQPRFIFDQPLAYEGEPDMMPIIKNSLETIGIPKDIYLDTSVDIKTLFESIKPFLLPSR